MAGIEERLIFLLHDLRDLVTLAPLWRALGPSAPRWYLTHWDNDIRKKLQLQAEVFRIPVAGGLEEAVKACQPETIALTSTEANLVSNGFLSQFAVCLRSLAASMVVIQHGIYLGPYYLDRPHAFLADKVVAWGPAQLDHFFSREERWYTHRPNTASSPDQFVPLGNPNLDMLFNTASRAEGGPVAVFSNLHWRNRYTNLDKEMFIREVFRAAREFPNKTFLWKLHPLETDFVSARPDKPNNVEIQLTYAGSEQEAPNLSHQVIGSACAAICSTTASLIESCCGGLPVVYLDPSESPGYRHLQRFKGDIAPKLADIFASYPEAGREGQDIFVRDYTCGPGAVERILRWLDHFSTQDDNNCFQERHQAFLLELAETRFEGIFPINCQNVPGQLFPTAITDARARNWLLDYSEHRFDWEIECDFTDISLELAPGLPGSEAGIYGIISGAGIVDTQKLALEGQVETVAREDLGVDVIVLTDRDAKVVLKRDDFENQERYVLRLLAHSGSAAIEIKAGETTRILDLTSLTPGGEWRFCSITRRNPTGRNPDEV